MCTGEEDCFEILRELEPVADRWYKLGLALGLRPSTLDRMRTSGQTDDPLLNTIRKWLNMSYDAGRFGAPTWRRMVEAVRDKSGGGNPALAAALARKYCGKLTIVSPNMVVVLIATTKIIQL